MMSKYADALVTPTAGLKHLAEHPHQGERVSAHGSHCYEFALRVEIRRSLSAASNIVATPSTTTMQANTS